MSASACPACSAAPLAQVQAQRALDAKGQETKVTLSLPTIHCSGCIATVERILDTTPGVKDARVNLTLKRAMIVTDGTAMAQELADLLTVNGYEAYELDQTTISQTSSDKEGRVLLMRLAVSGFAMMNVMLLSIAVWAGADGPTRDMFHWISAFITLPATAFTAQPFFKSAWSALRARRLNMDVPISLAILLALVTSVWETMLSGEHAFFDAAIALTFFLLAGRYLDHRTRSIARSAAEELTALEVPRALKVGKEGIEQVWVSHLSVGDIILVRPGGRMPVDGVVVSGTSEVDRSLITGETRPEFTTIGKLVSAGEVNLTGPLEIRATAVGEDTSLHQIAELVAIAESGRSNYTSIADKAAQLYAPGVHIMSALTFIGWYLWSFDLRMSLNIASAVLIITCPCALGLAVPAVTTAASGRLFKRGLLIKNATALERIAEIDTVVFDKTGTLTKGTPGLDHIPTQDKDYLAVAMSLAAASNHPLSKAIVAELNAQGIIPADLDSLQEEAGFGISALWAGRKVKLGRAEWLGQIAETQDDATATWLQIDDELPLRFTFSDDYRVGAARMIQTLKSQGLSVYLYSGDNAGAVEKAARDLGIDHFTSAMAPMDKATAIEALSASGRKVLMVGDGLNDTAALAGAHASISPSSALDASRVVSDIVLLGQDIAPISDAIATARQAQKRIHENFQLATLYNIVAIPVAIIGLATPLIAALAMSLSSITVSLNALRLR